MSNYLSCFFPLLILVTYVSNSFCQSFENIYAQQNGDRIIITYDLNSPDKQYVYHITVFSSLDNFTRPLQFVYGDVGDNVPQGKGKKIEWFPERDGEVYTGPISFELRGQTVKPVNIPHLSTSFPEKGKIKRGKKYTIRWDGGLPDSKIDIDLFRNGTQVEPVARSVVNNHEFEWAVNRSKINGADFYLVISDQKYGGNSTDSDKFKVVTPVNPMIKATVAVAAIIGIYAIIQSE